MHIFVKNPEGKTITLNVKSREMIYSVLGKLEVKERMPSDVVPKLIYGGKELSNWRTLANYHISKWSILDFVTRKRVPHIYVDTLNGKIISLRIVGLNTIKDVKAKIYEQEGITPDTQRLFFDGKELLDGNQTLLENHIRMDSTLHLRGTIMNSEGPQSAPIQLRKRSTPQLAPVQTKKVRPATQITTSKAAPSRQRLILDTSDGEVCGEVLATCADGQAMSNNKYEAKLNEFALYQAKATAALSDLMPEIRSRLPASVLADLEDAKHELATSRSKEKELEATISSQCACYESQIVALKAENKETNQELTVARSKEKEQEAILSKLTHKYEVFSAQCVSYESQVFALEAENKKTVEKLMVACNKEKVFSAQCDYYESLIVALKAENKKTTQELTVARSKEKELEASISRLTQENKVFSARCVSYESQIVTLKAENKETKQDLTVARNNEKEQEAIISKLTHKNEVFSAQCVSYESGVVALEAEYKKTTEKLMVARNKEKVFSAQCASYESQAIALETEYKKTKGELMVADKKYYSGARAAGYAEGLKEGKTKWLKSVEFLHRLTDASMQYFNYGFDSCQKQAEQQGFVGQLNKESALKNA